MDCTFLTEHGKFNWRVGVIVTNGRKVLMETDTKAMDEVVVT